jgi:hypothetical protein
LEVEGGIMRTLLAGSLIVTVMVLVSGAITSSASAVSVAKWKVVQFTPKPIGSALSEFYGASYASPTAWTAVGTYDNSSETYVTLTEDWNGTTWSVQSTPKPRGDGNELPLRRLVHYV